MQIVQTRRRHTRRPVGKIERDRLGLYANPPIAIAAVWAEFVISTTQSPSGAQRKNVRIPSHRWLFVLCGHECATSMKNCFGADCNLAISDQCRRLASSS